MDNPARPTSDHDRAALKGACDRAVKRAGGVTALANLTRVKVAALSKYGNGCEPDHFMPLDVAADADMVAGAPVILSALAAIEGFAVVSLPSPVPPGGPTTGMVGNLIKESGEVSAAVLAAMADGTITPNERAAIATEIDEALTALWRIRAALNGEGA